MTKFRLFGVARITWLVSVPLCLAIGLGGSAASAQNPSGPIYSPETKSYFELRTDARDGNQGGYWRDADRLASALQYKGVRGRLAVVDNKKVHDFLRRNFVIKVQTWIGLRYWCRFGKLQWANGKTAKKGEYSNWHTQWYRLAITMCGAGTATGPLAYMPVYYTPTASGFKWQASGPAKGFARYFVEYPTGGR